MTILLKYILKCLWQNKVRTGLILCAIMISSGMLFSSISISSSLVQIQMKAWRSSYGYSDIIIHAGNSSPTPWFYMNEALAWESSCEYVIGEISGFGTLTTAAGVEIQSSVRGIDWADLQKLTPIRLFQDTGTVPFTGGKIVLGKNTADRYDLTAGDILYLTLQGTRHSLKLSGVAVSEGSFAGDSLIVPAIIPRDRLASFLDTPGRVDRIYLKVKHPELKYRLITKLSIPYKRYTVRESFLETEVKKQTDKTAMPMIMIAVILSFMSIFILYSAFRVIMMERLPVIGTFRSIGATIRSTRFILLVESCSYGILGGLAGCGFGILLLSILSRVVYPAEMRSDTSILCFNPLHLIPSFVVAVLMSLAGAYAPAVKISRLPIREMIFSASSKERNKKTFSALSGIFLLIASLVAPSVSPAESGKWISTGSVVLVLISIILLIPGITLFFSYTAGWLFRFLFRNEGFLALKQIRQDRNSRNNIALLVIGVSGLFMVTTLNDGEMRQIMDCFNRCNYDILVRFPYPNRNDKNLLEGIPGIEAILENQEESVIHIEGLDEPLYHIQGIDPEKFKEFHTLSVPQGQEELPGRIDNGRNILLTTILRDKWNLKTGDTLNLILPGSRGNKVYRTYTVLGFYDNLFPGRWSYALISKNNFKRDIASDRLGSFYVKSNGTREAVTRIQSIFARRKPEVQTIEEMKEEILKENNQVFTILRFFSIITAITGIFGMLNNITLSFMERKRTLAILRSLGMTHFKMIEMLLAEGCACGLIGGLTGVGAGILVLSNIIPFLIKAIGSETRIYFSVPILLYCFAGGFVIPQLASLGSILRLRKMNLVSAIKYE